MLQATQTQGARPVVLGPFVGNVSVTADGKVNGTALPSDRELAHATRLASTSLDDKKAELKQVGISEGWLGRAA